MSRTDFSTHALSSDWCRRLHVSVIEWCSLLPKMGTLPMVFSSPHSSAGTLAVRHVVRHSQSEITVSQLTVSQRSQSVSDHSQSAITVSQRSQSVSDHSQSVTVSQSQLVLLLCCFGVRCRQEGRGAENPSPANQCIVGVSVIAR